MNKLPPILILLTTVAIFAESLTPDPSDHRQASAGTELSERSHEQRPAESQPSSGTGQDQAIKTAPTQNTLSPTSNTIKKAQESAISKTPLDYFTTSKSASQSNIILSLLPWCFAVFMATLAGAAMTYIIVLKRQERHFSSLRESILNGSNSVHLLPVEATRLIHDFTETLKKGAKQLDETVEKQRIELEKIVETSEETSRASKEFAQRTVDTFKGSLNETLEKIRKFMERMVQDTKDTHNQALETKEFAKQVSALIHEKELEISKLKEGYHLHLIRPLTETFLKIRDDIHLLANLTADPQIRQQLSDLDQRIGNALSELQIEELPIQVGEKPDLIHHPSLWESLGAAETTDNRERHGTIARIQERGYQFRINNGEPHIIRKAIVVIYSDRQLNVHPAVEPIIPN